MLSPSILVITMSFQKLQCSLKGMEIKKKRFFKTYDLKSTHASACYYIIKN